jgi:hypothetical protein
VRAARAAARTVARSADARQYARLCAAAGTGSAELGPVSVPGARAIGSAGERLVHTEEVTGSIPVSPTG